MKKKISVEIVADSISPQGHRITTCLWTYPKFIHSELIAHRMFSGNPASSRAIPFEKMVKMVEEDPFIPIAWQKDNKGMQGTEYFVDKLNIEAKEAEWIIARNHAINQARQLSSMDVTKQLCNRLLEPFMWHTVLVTATEYENFFELSCPKYKFGNKTYRSKRDWYNDPILTTDDGFHGDAFPHEDDMWWYSINESDAEIHIQALAEAMWDAINNSTPKDLGLGDFHIPFENQIDKGLFGPEDSEGNWLYQGFDNKLMNDPNISQEEREIIMETIYLKISTAISSQCTDVEPNQEIDFEKSIQLHDKLLTERHLDAFEHCARTMSDYEYRTITNKLCNDFKGFIKYRYLIENNI